MLRRHNARSNVLLLAMAAFFSVTRNLPSVAPSMCSSISAATPIASPSPTIDWFRCPTIKSPFAGAIPLTTTSRN